MSESPRRLSAMDRLVERLCRLPGIGRRSAQRIVYHLLQSDPQEATELAEAIRAFRVNLRACSQCGNVTESDPCPLCDDPRRDHATLLVVEQPGDITALETTGQYRGLYHVLMGRLSPLDGVGPGDLNIDALLQRIDQGRIKEVILGTHPTSEGDGTALYLVQQLTRTGVKVTRLARGLPTGATLDIVSKAVLGDAIQGRQAMR
ncbi:MAG: recombination protein RecR [Phycisphaeraceae bacterium]|nr:recombination protein RecR [Phycisphaeraceae bacterium]